MQTKLSRWFEEHDLTRTSGKFIVDSMAVAKHCALAGLGIVTLPKLATRDEIVSGELVDIEVEDFRLNRLLSYLSRKRRSVACCVEIFNVAERASARLFGNFVVMATIYSSVHFNVAFRLKTSSRLSAHLLK